MLVIVVIDLLADKIFFSPIERFLHRRWGRTKTVSLSRDTVIRVYDDAGNVIETQEHTGDFKEW
jgi:hypothetical protein